jgi:hypothetical protein
MTTLRVVVAAPPSADRADPWSLFDASGTCVANGVDVPAAWPRADETEFVLAASVVRIAVVTLPRLPAARVAAAVRYELEDALAGPDDAHQLAVSPQGADGRVRVLIAARELVARIAAAPVRAARIIAEPDLAPPLGGWRWCAADTDVPGFIRRADGTAFPVDAPSAAAALPAELALALAQSQRLGTAPASVRVDADFADASLARWQHETGVAFVRGPRWRWHDASADTFAAALDLLPPSPHASIDPAKGGHVRLFKPALWLAGAALALHVAASVADWASLALGEWRDAREWRALATAIGVPAEAAAAPASARAGIAHRYAELRHAHGLAVDDDALPLLARIAPALRGLSSGALRSAAYAYGHWTLDLGAAEATVLRDLDLRLRAAGVPAITASTPSGARVRIGEL